MNNNNLDIYKDIKQITREQARIVISKGDCSDFQTDTRRYYYTYCTEGVIKYVGLDYFNSEGYVEEFPTKELCFSWLNGEFEMSEYLENIKEDNENLYTVNVKETQSGFIEIYAGNEDEAYEIAQEEYNNGNITWTNTDNTQYWINDVVEHPSGCIESKGKIKYIATTIWRGLGNQSLIIYAKNDDEAFFKLLQYYQNKRECLGEWNKNGFFETYPDWDYYIEEESKMKIIE